MSLVITPRRGQTYRRPRPLDDDRQTLTAGALGIAFQRARDQKRKTWAADLPDLISAALDGLVEAASRWDETTGAPFNPYASVVIKYRVQEASQREGLVRKRFWRQTSPRRRGLNDGAWSKSRDRRYGTPDTKARAEAKGWLADRPTIPAAGSRSLAVFRRR